MFLQQLGQAVTQGDQRFKQNQQQDLLGKMMAVNPQFAAQYTQNMGALQNQQMNQRQEARQQQQRQALSQMAANIGNMPQQEALTRLAQATGDPRYLETLAGVGAGSDPASVKLANEIQQARSAGDTQRVNDLIASAKLYDKGIVIGEDGTYQPATGYGGALGDLARGEKFGGKIGELEAEGLLAPAVEAAKEAAKLGEQLTFNPKIKTAEQEAEFKQAGLQGLIPQQRAIESMSLQNDFIKSKADQVFNGIDGLLKTGFTGNLASAIPGTPAYALQSDIKTLTADSGINSLLEAKAKGATFGALQEKELDLLIALKGALDQGLPADKLASNLSKFMKQRDKVFNLMKKQYNEDYQRFEGKKDEFLPAPEAGAISFEEFMGE